MSVGRRWPNADSSIPAVRVAVPARIDRGRQPLRIDVVVVVDFCGLLAEMRSVPLWRVHILRPLAPGAVARALIGSGKAPLARLPGTYSQARRLGDVEDTAR
jgi:hypothetical protein